MSALLDLIKSQLRESDYQALGQQIGAAPEGTKSAVNEALPLLVGALSTKASANSGMGFLVSLLDKDQDGSALDDIIGMVTGGESPPQGQASVQTILGNEIGPAENHVAQRSGLDLSTVSKLLPLLAPIVLGALSKAQSSRQMNKEDVKSFLENERETIVREEPQAGDFLSSMFDRNGDGSVMDDVMQMGMGAVGNLFRK